jgi:diaminopimelate decarboxylase
MLLASVLGTKEAEDTCFAIMDAGINLAESCRSEYHQLLPVSRHGEPATKTYTFVGPICVPGDTLYWAARMPELRVGDSVVVMDAGAYFVPFATSFSFPQPPIVRVDGEQVTLLRRGERFEDLVSLDQPAG